MAKNTKKPIEISYKKLPFELAGYNLGPNYYPPIVKNDGGFQIRILVYSSRSLGGNTSEKYDYFKLNEEGIIISCPRGYTAHYKGLKVIDIQEGVEFYAKKRTQR